MEIRKIVTYADETRREAGRAVDPPIRRVIAAAVLANPHAGSYAEDLSDLWEASVELSRMLASAAVAGLGGAPVHSYGKGGIVGTDGELEHVAAMLHPKFGGPLREACGGGKSIIPSAKKRGPAGHAARHPPALQGRRLRAQPLRCGRVADRRCAGSGRARDRRRRDRWRPAPAAYRRAPGRRDRR